MRKKLLLRVIIVISMKIYSRNYFQPVPSKNAKNVQDIALFLAVKNF